MDLARFPRVADVQIHEATLNPGDSLFLPSYWFHYILHLPMNAHDGQTRWEPGRNIAVTITRARHDNALQPFALSIIEKHRRARRKVAGSTNDEAASAAENPRETPERHKEL